MLNEVVVVFVHGINVTSQDYYEKMRDRILRAMPRKVRGSVVFRSVFWADIVRGRQQEYMLYARTTTAFRGGTLHKLVIEGLGDAAAYQKTWERDKSAYFDIQERLRRTLHDAANGPRDERPLVFIGHSLGCHIISSYAWDTHKLKAKEDFFNEHDGELAERLAVASPLERLDTFAGFVTMGSNMPLFTFTFGPQRVYPITRTTKAERTPAFPGAKLTTAVRKHARWLNFFSANDPLGYPLKPLNDFYDEEPLLSDIHARSEGIMRSILLPGRLRPLNALKAHNGYWTNSKVVRKTARLITELVLAEEMPASSGPPLQPPQKPNMSAPPPLL